MGFWIFMQIMVLMIPLIMIITGKRFIKSAPKEINLLFGYRTEMSTKNMDTWEFAHKHFGKIWFRAGLVLLPVSVIPMLFVTGESTDIVGTVGTVVTFIGVIVLIASIIPTEIALKKTFDKDGKRKDII